MEWRRRHWAHWIGPVMKPATLVPVRSLAHGEREKFPDPVWVAEGNERQKGHIAVFPTLLWAAA